MPVVRRLLALTLLELLVWQPLLSLRQPLFGTAQAAPRYASTLAATPASPESSGATEEAGAVETQDAMPIANSAGLDVSVAFADSATPSADFPTPWQGAPNVLYLGGGAPVNAGAIRIDNTSGAPVPVERVTVDLQRDNAVFSLWTNFVIPANGSAILTQTQPGNFDTSAYPIVPCGGTLPANDPRVPKITVTIAGIAQTFVDTAHVLDTGGFDSSCRGNESLQWRAVGTRGTDAPSGTLTLTPANVSGSGGSSVTLTSRLRDANGSPLANVLVDFRAVSGPNAGQTGQAVTDSLGYARFSYLGTAQGADVVHASVTNASGETVASNDATVTWQTASCGPDVPLPPTGEPALLYVGATSAQYSDAIELAALLTDGSGTPVAGRSLTFTFGTQTFTSVTDATGVARVATTVNIAPSEVPVAVDFAGGSGIPALRVTQTVTIEREDVLLEYTGKTLLGTAVPQTVSAKLRDPDSLAPLAGKTITFTVGSVSVTAITDSNGNATMTMVLGPDQVSGPASLTVSFAGDAYYEPAFRTVAVTIYLSTSFVVWGGNTGGLKLGDRVNFWGAQWESQVRQGDYPANASFKGFADPLKATNDQIHVCQPNATSKTLTPTCWVSKGGQSWPPPVSIPNYIEVIVSTVIAKGGNDIYGNIAAAAVVKVEPGYDPVPGKPGYGTIVAVIEDSNVFPAPAAIAATQTQPRTVLPNEQFTVTTTVANTSAATAATAVALNETLDGLTPSAVTRDLGTIVPGGSQTTSFQATTPSIPIRSASETPAEYLRRLSSLNGRVYTAAGQVTFTDANQQLYLPVHVSSQSVLTIPVLTLALTGPAVVSPGSAAPYRVTITNIGSAPATASVDLMLPDGTTRTFSVADLVPGSSHAQTESFTPEAIAPKGESETTEAYLSRLQAADGQLLTTRANLSWRDANGNAYGDVGQQIFTSRIRVPVLTFTTEAPATLLPTQIATLRMNVRNTGGCTAVLSNLKVTNPDGSVFPAPQFVLAGGQSTTIDTTWRVPEVPKRDEDGETDAQYLARLQAVNNSPLNFAIALDWSDPGGAVYGPTAGSTQSREIISIVPITLTAPAEAVAGTSITYTAGAQNVGSATAPQTDLTIFLPDGSTQKPAVPSLAPGATFQATIDYAIPSTHAAGTIQGEAFVMWTDIAGNAYGPFEASAATEVTNPQQFNKLVLTPAAAGPNVRGTTQTMTAKLTGQADVPISGAPVTFTVTGANPSTGTANTDAQGVATFTYTGANAGADTVQATSGTAVSNAATVNWIAPVQKISTTPMYARFFFTNGSGTFNTPPSATPAFIQAFPTINFNPPSGTVPGNTSGVGVNTRPFTNVTTDLNGNFTGTIVAEGNGLRAGVGTLFDFQAVFTGSFTVASAGQMAISFYSDDGFVFGVGGGATRVSGPMLNVPSGGKTPFEQLPVMGAYNAPTAPVANTVVVSFPAAGTYPYEVDYSECCAGQLALTVAAGNVSNRGLPPTGSLKLTPINLTAKPTGQTQTLTVEAFDASGLPVANAHISVVVNGPNARELPGVTGADGRATVSYSATRAGTDTAQAIGRVSGLGTYSNIVNVPWSVSTSGGGEPDPDFPPGPGNIGAVVTQGWIGAPLIGSTITTRTNVTSTVSMVSGRLDFWPSDNPNEVTVLRATITGGGTLAAIDPTLLANGEYVLRLMGTLSNGTQQTSLIVFNVTGDNKPGRVTKFVTDLRVPVAGMPITISRQYDSLERAKVGDFGYGWSLVTSARLDVNKKNDVTFTMNGRRQTFKFAPQSFGFPFTFFLQPKWVPEPGAYGTLTAESCGLLILSQGQFTCFLDTVGGGFRPTSYTYTDPYGRQYVMGADGSMQLIKERDGHTLTFTRDGIVSSASGVTVPFVRDAQGRITKIVDPAGNSYDYTYDALGDLTSVQLPRLPNPVRYEYATGHFLTKEIDPRGATSSATYYADGRLQSETDRLNNTVQYAYNTTANTVTTTYADGGTVVVTNNASGYPVSIRDQLNRTTSFTYDANNNPLTSTNALGKTWTWTYDANGNITSIKDPNGNVAKKNWSSSGLLLTATDALNQIKSFTYDTAGNPTAMTDTIGTLMAASYDTKGNQTSMTLPSGRTAQFGYDAFGNVTTLTDHSGFTSALEYDSLGQLTKMRDSRHGETTLEFDPVYGNETRVSEQHGGTLRYTYDSNGNLLTEVDAHGKTTTHEYDANDRLIRTTFPDGRKVELAYDFAGRVTTRTEEDGDVEKYVWDKAGQLTSITSAFGTPLATTATIQYDPAGRVNSITDGRNNTTVFTYDDGGRVKTMRDPAGRSITYTYDANGQATHVARADNVTVETRYDVRGRATTYVQPGGATFRNVYDGMHLLQTIDENGKATSYTYDNHGEVATVTDPANNVVTYFRDAVGNLTGVRDANGNTTTYEYDQLDRLVKKILPDASYEAYTYDLLDQVTSVRLTDGNVNRYFYDDDNELIRIEYYDGTTQSFTYNAGGQRETATTAQGVTRYEYDDLDRLVKITQPTGVVIAYGYDAADNITSITTPRGVTRYTYDPLDRVKTMTDPAGGVTTYNYDLGGRLTQRLLPNGVITNYTYDTSDYLTGVAHHLGSAAAFESFVYTLNPNGQRVSVQEVSGTRTDWTYDEAYRLIREKVVNASGTPLSELVYAYDRAGNRRSMTANGVTTLYEYNQLDQLTTAGAVQYDYDDRGNLVAVIDGPNTTAYGYDAANRLARAVMPDGVTANFAYDADDRLTRETIGGIVRGYAWDEQAEFGGEMVYEYDGVTNTPVASYSYAGDELVQRLGAASSYYLHDGLGSVIGLTNAAGVQTDRYRYDAWGVPTLATGTTPNPFRYRGQFTDDVTGLLYLRARYFAPRTGRFLTRDVAPFDLENPIDLNRYRYAASNPVDYYDPTGFAAAAEYGGIVRRQAENAQILGYRAGRLAETLISCAGVLLAAQGVSFIIRNMINYGIKYRGKKVWVGTNNVTTAAFGWTVKRPIDLAGGPDRFINGATEAGRKLFLAKAAMYRSAPRELSWALSGRSGNRLFKALGGAAAWLFNGFFINDRGSGKAYHAERKIVRRANPPVNALLSVGASRNVCSTCFWVLMRRVKLYGGCFGPIGTRNR